MTVIDLQNITAGHNGDPVITGFNLQVEKGEAVCLTAPSGHGKSTLLHLLAGLSDPLSGSCEVNAKEIAYTFQEPPLLPWMSVAENIRFLAGKGCPCRSGKSWQIWTMRLGLTDALSKKTSQLSGGMKRRVGIACALSVASDLVLLDEPFASLDAHWQTEVAQCIFDHREANGTTLVMVSHETLPLKGQDIRIVAMG